MKRMVVNPDGWPCTFNECPPGFFVFEDNLYLKSEYRSEDKSDAYCESGEYFWGGTGGDVKKRGALKVQPVIVEWEEFDA